MYIENNIIYFKSGESYYSKECSEKSIRDTLASLKATRNRLDKAIKTLEDIINYDLIKED